MASFLSLPSINPGLNSQHRTILPPINHSRIVKIRCAGDKSTSSKSTGQRSEPENAFLKVAWYGSELLGIAASFLRSPSATEASQKDLKLADDGSGTIDRATVVESIKDDFLRSYFVTGNVTVPTQPVAARNLTPDAYEEDCEFADPAGSFKGLGRFKRNCSNFGLLIEKSDMKLMKWEDFEDKGIGHWRFSCIMSFPWKPILSATGYTEYYFDAESGRVCRHVEHWNVPKMALFKQLLRPSRRKTST